MEKWRKVVAGVGLAIKKPRFWVGWCATVVVFGTLINLLAGGMAAFNLMGTVGFPAALKVIGDAFLGIFGIGRAFGDWLPMFSLTVLQATLIGMLVVVWHERKVNPPACQIQRTPKKASVKVAENQAIKTAMVNQPGKTIENTTKAGLWDQLQNTGIVAGLAVLGSGCPTCGTTLLAPIVASLFGSTSLALAGTLAGILNIGAVALALWTLWKLGLECYTIMNRMTKEEK